MAWSGAALHRDIAPLLARAGLVETRGRMAISRLTGAAAGDAVATVEPTPEGLVYTGVVAGWLSWGGREERLPQALLFLLASMRSTNALGGANSVGLGACTFVIDCVALGSSTLTGQQALAQLERLGVAEDA